MSGRESISRSSGGQQDHEQEEVQVASQGQTIDVDDILNDIDSVLEKNAEEFVKGFVQKGGQ